MRKLFPLLLLLYFNLSAQVNDADAFFNGSYDKGVVRKNKIKQVNVDISIDGKNSTRYTFEFDRKGFLLKETITNATGKKVNDYTFTYNDHGDQTSRKNNAYELGKTYETSFNKKYSGAKLISESSSELPYTTLISYNNQGQKLLATTYLGNDTINDPKRHMSYHYDGSGKLIMMVQTLSTSKNTHPTDSVITKFSYDDAGKLNLIDRNGQTEYRFIYDSKGLLKTRETIIADGWNDSKIVDEFSYTFW
ncbi:hypothetical protein [Pollutibacter soli]|uniref:hypothetical protein n=1 Tax=Pollutibacter soli TaxID=3034157 RepID=UPI003013F1FE